MSAAGPSQGARPLGGAAHGAVRGKQTSDVALPVDASWAAPLRRQLAAITGLVETTSRFGPSGRLAWRFNEREIAHLHAPPMVDIRLPREAQKTFSGDPRLVPRAGRSEWIECRMEAPGDVAFVAELVCCAAGKALSVRRR